MKILITTCAVLLGVCGAALAAHDSVDMMKFHSATAFLVGGTELPAGDNTIQVLGGDGNFVVLVRSEAGPQAYVLTNRLNGGPGGNSEVHVTLQRRGDVYRLDKIWLLDGTVYQVLQPSVE